MYFETMNISWQRRYKLVAKLLLAVWLETYFHFSPTSSCPPWNIFTISFIPHFMHIALILLVNAVSEYFLVNLLFVKIRSTAGAKGISDLICVFFDT